MFIGRNQIKQFYFGQQRAARVAGMNTGYNFSRDIGYCKTVWRQL